MHAFLWFNDISGINKRFSFVFASGIVFSFGFAV